MSPDRWRQVGNLMMATLEVEPAQRAVFLETACAADAVLRQEVEALLDFHAEAGRFLSQPADAPGPDEPSGLEGRRIGNYRLVGEIGRGGMGTVYLALRADGLHDVPVALKVIRRGRDSQAVVGRFENERRILAALRHPGIARLLDGGTTDDLPYFVMEYVPGRPILDFVEERALSVAKRLDLFRAVCEAVQYAHQSLVVHRDLKPANIVVDEDGQPKLLDFGIAKVLATDDDASDTVTERPPFTPGYASPEQVRDEPVTVASDVYSLGVLLFELLAGARPYEVEGLSAAEVERVICTQEPPRPSTVAARKRGRIATELDSIVLKALRKEPSERYATVLELWRDVGRFLAGLPVRARANGFGYRTRKFVRRHRWGLATASAFVLLGSTAGVNAWRQQRHTERVRIRAEQVSAYLVDLFEVLDPAGASDPAHPRADSVTARDLLDRGESRLPTLEGQPEAQAAIMNTIGLIHSKLDLHEDAKRLLQRSLDLRRRLHGPDHVDVAESLVSLADAHARSGEHAPATALAEEALAIYRARKVETLAGVAHAQALAAMAPVHQGRLDVAETLLREALATSRRVGSGTEGTIADLLNAMTVLLNARGAYGEAESLLRDALSTYRARGQMRRDEAARVLDSLAQALSRDSRISLEAESLLREAIDIRRHLYREPTTPLARGLGQLGYLLAQRGAFDEAQALYLESAAILRRTQGEKDAALASPLCGLASVRYATGDLDSAERLYRESLEIARRPHPYARRYLSCVLVGLGSLLTDRGELAPAEGFLREGLEVRRRMFPAGSPRITEAENALGAWLAASGRFAEAEPLLAETAKKLQASLGDEHTTTRRAMKRLADLERRR